MHTNGFASAVGVANYDYDLIPFTSYSESSASDITLLMCVVNSQCFLSNDKNYRVGTQEVLEFRKNFFSFSFLYSLFSKEIYYKDFY